MKVYNLYLGLSSADMVLMVAVPGWLKAVQALQCIGCIAMLGALAYHVVIDCCMTAPPEKRVGEAIAILGGTQIFTARACVCVFACVCVCFNLQVCVSCFTDRYVWIYFLFLNSL